jgi:protein involved in polysaccharide export with SLBB domain
MNKLMKAISCLMLLGLLGACASTKPYLPDSKKVSKIKGEDFLVDENESMDSTSKDSEIEIRPGFLIQLKSSLDPQLNGTFRVAFDGTLKLPYQVNLKTTDLTMKTLSQKINQSFSQYFKKGATIDVSLSEKKFWVEVRGLVQKPGLVLVAEREKIEGLIAKTGGLSQENEAHIVQIIRGENNFYVDLQEYFQGSKAQKSAIWVGGEKVLFLKASAAVDTVDSENIHVIGDVRNPGGFVFQTSTDFYHYLVKAGGTTATSNLEKIDVIRETRKGRVTTTGTSDEIAKNIKLQAGDVIVVNSNMPGKFERNLQLSSTIASLISAIAILFVIF